MSLRIVLKLFIENQGPKPTDYVPVFHGFIQSDCLKEVLVDVADYSHVVDGPGIVLIGHEADYSIDFEKGRAGLRYSRKRAPELASEAAEVTDSLSRLLTVAALLEADSRLGGVKFATTELEFKFADRLRFPASSEGDAAARPLLESALAKLFPQGFELSRTGSPNELLGFKVKVSKAESVVALGQRLS